jgi:hypothetical protein
VNRTRDLEEPPQSERAWGRTLAGGLLLGLGLVGMLLLLYGLARDVAIWVFGRHITAQVQEIWVERIGDQEEGELTFHYYASYRFTTPGGQVVENSTRLDVREWGALTESGPLDIVYFPLYPALNRLSESRFISILACAYVPLIVAAWACLGGGWYLLRPGQGRDWWFSSTRRSP